MLFDYLSEKTINILFVIAQNIANHFLLLTLQFTLTNIKVPLKKIFCCAVFFSLLYVLPIYLVDFAMFYPSRYFEVWLYSLLVFINPITALLFYVVIRKTIGFSPTRSAIVVKLQVIMHYIVALSHMVFISWLPVYLGSVELAPGFFLGDIISILMIIALLGMIHSVIKGTLKKTQRYITIPPHYAEKNIMRTLAKLFITFSTLYAIIVGCQIVWLPHVRIQIEYAVGFFYVLLLAILFIYLLYTISSFRIQVLVWALHTNGIYISSLLHANQEFRAVKHDFYNLLHTYGGYLDIEDYEGLKKHHRELFSITKHAGDFLNLIDVLKSRIAVYGLLRSMSEKADKAGVALSINNVCDITQVVLSDLDFCRVLSIVIDNAIEAAQISQKKQVTISIEYSSKTSIAFIISNTTQGEVDCNAIFAEGFTTKDNHAGIGLPQVVRILNTYENCTVKCSYHENQFTLFLLLSTHADD